jgi:hypothetical protein
LLQALAITQVRIPDESFTALYEVSCFIFVAAFFPPKLRTLSFAIGIAYIYISHLDRLASLHVVVEIFLYSIGAIAFLRCSVFPAPSVFACCLTALLAAPQPRRCLSCPVFGVLRAQHSRKLEVSPPQLFLKGALLETGGCLRARVCVLEHVADIV